MEVSRGGLVFILCCYTMLVTVSGKTGSGGLFWNLLRFCFSWLALIYIYFYNFWIRVAFSNSKQINCAHLFICVKNNVYHFHRQMFWFLHVRENGQQGSAWWCQTCHSQDFSRLSGWWVGDYNSNILECCARIKHGVSDRSLPKMRHSW